MTTNQIGMAFNAFIDDDSMATATATNVASAESIKAYVDAQLTTGVPVGSMTPYAGTSLPSGWLACDGAAVSRATYAALFTAISTTWGVGDGSTTFNVPNMQRRAAVGSGGTGTGTLGNAVGNTGGAETVTLTTTEMPSHNHDIGPTSSASNTGGGIGNAMQQATVQSGNRGGGGAHNNIAPSAVVMYIIKT